MKKPMADAGEKCPLWQKDVSKVCHACPWYTLLRGKNPQSGAEIDEWGCAISWLPVLLIETSKEVRQGAAATESFRNEMVVLRATTGLLPLVSGLSGNLLFPANHVKE